MTMPYYASAEQVMRDRSEYARKGIARGRSAVVLTYEGGVLFVAENLTTLRKISEIYDRIGFAAVGRYSEFESLRVAGVRLADLHATPGARLLLTVHDELVLEVPEEQAEAVAQIVKAEMEGVADLKVPLVVDVGWGRSWYEAKG